MANKLTSFFREKKIVCLGGGVGTVNLISGLKKYTKNITVVISMADEGGSAGRLRRLYNIFPPGDLISCMAAMSKNTKLPIKELLTYRFNGNRYGKDEHLVGHKLGNLMMVALRDITGDFEKAIATLQKMLSVEGTFFPATNDAVSISAKTIEGKEIFGEEKID
ncbi:MAG: gluconeogenesis factor YvcK family protein, partial [Candidatus Levyibacteriota bacterium]